MEGRRVAVIVLVCAVGAGCGTLLSADPDPPASDIDTGTGGDAAATGDGADGSADAPLETGADAGHHLVFATSETPRGDGIGTSGDARCQQAATRLKTPHGNFVAWLSYATRPARDHLADYGPWYTTTGQRVAISKADLLDGNIDSPINADEVGSPFNAKDLVWTGTNSSGAAGDNCNDWTGGGAGTSGVPTQADATWTDITLDSLCDSPGHIYCFEQHP